MAPQFTARTADALRGLAGVDSGAHQAHDGAGIAGDMHGALAARQPLDHGRSQSRPGAWTSGAVRGAGTRAGVAQSFKRRVHQLAQHPEGSTGLETKSRRRP